MAAGGLPGSPMSLAGSAGHGLTEPNTPARRSETELRPCDPEPMILTAPTARPIESLVRRVGRFLPRGWADLAMQLMLFALLDVLYELSRVVAAGDRGVALRHSRDIVSAERSLGIFHELSVQHFAATAPGIVQSIANWTYFNCQFTISFGFLFWVYLRRNQAFPLVRNVFVAANAIALVIYTLYPALVVFSVVATANHFFLDAAGGASVAALATVAMVAVHRRSSSLLATLVALPVASFLIYRFAGQAVDVADTLGAVAAGPLALALAANLGSVWLKAAVWRRAVIAVPGAPRMTTRQLLP